MNLALRLSILLLIIFIVEFYFYKRTSESVKNIFPKIKRRAFKISSIIVLSFFNLYAIIGLFYLVYFWITGNRPSFPPDNFIFDALVQFPFWAFMLYVIQLTILFLTIDVFRIVLFPVYRNNKSKVKAWIFKMQFVLIAFFLIYVPARIIYDYFGVSVRVVEFEKKDLPDALNGFKITFISDVQADKYTNSSRLDKYMQRVNETNPGLVLIAGDVITSSPKYIKKSAEYLGKVKAKYGVFSCVGDHDNWAYREDTQKSLREIKAALSEKGIEMLDNQKKIIRIDSASIGITFVTNTYVERINSDFLDSLTNGELKKDLKIFLTHQPRQFLIDDAAKKEYDLFLAGHTHGGQLTFFFPFYNLSPTLFETKYVRGDFRFGDMLAIVTRGLGMSLVPMRYNSTPEITVVVLRKR